MWQRTVEKVVGGGRGRIADLDEAGLGEVAPEVGGVDVQLRDAPGHCRQPEHRPVLRARHVDEPTHRISLELGRTARVAGRLPPVVHPDAAARAQEVARLAVVPIRAADRPSAIEGAEQVDRADGFGGEL